jgi:hypothetical protein
MRRAQPLTFLWALCLTACTYGPAQHRVWIKQAEGRPETRTFAAIVQSQVRREATGLAAFPDGGKAKISDQLVTMYVADVDQRVVRRMGQIPVPAEVYEAFEPFLLGWKGPAFYVQLSGCPRHRSECWGKLTRRIFYRVGEDGAIARVDSVPRPLEREPGMGARAPGERVYMRITAWYDSVSVRTEDGGPFTARFVLNRERELVPKD